MNSILKGFMALGCLLMASSCSEISFGDKFLGNQPESSGATTKEMFSSRINAEKVLTKAYTGLPYGLPTTSDWKLGVNILESLTDLCYSFRDNINDGPLKLYYNGALSPTNVPRSAAYRYGSKADWTAIRYAWCYIENVKDVPDMSESEKSQRIAEAKTVIALCYFEMLRYVGGVTWIDHYVDVNEEMNFPRITFAQTVEKIVALLDEVINSNLKWKQDDADDGRMTKAGAMALKFKVLQWAASPTFNSDKKWHPQADEYTCYGNYSAQRWEAAKAAGEAFFAEVQRQGGYSLIQPEEDTHRARRLAYRRAYYNRGGTEILISTRHGYDVNTIWEYIDSRPWGYLPTLNYVDMFSWADGTDFPKDFNWQSPSRQPFFTVGDMEPTRDPRLYENVACPGDTYCNGTVAPVHLNHPNYKAGSGFMTMKFILQENS
ncbi:RagB/SusD family nutrient uptake outer membrane protein, partial [Bacteroides caccae]